MIDPQPIVAPPRGLRRPLSRLGLGAWVFGRTGWGTQNDQDSRAAILRAVELGVNWIDAAAVYGNGHAERIVGQVLAELSSAERPLVCTKAGIKVDAASGRTNRDLTPRSLRAECEGSMTRLGIECIDLYLLHWPVDDPGIVEQAWDTFGQLQREGKIHLAGVSNFDVDLLNRCAAQHPIDAVQIPLSLLSRDACRYVLPWTAQRDVDTLTYSPLESGLLSGRFTPRVLRSLPVDDWRSQRVQFQQPQLGRTWDLLARLKPIAAEFGASLAEMAIAWALAWPGVDGVVVGARSAGQVDGWAGASGLSLDDSVLDEIAAALLQTGAGDGPTHPHANPSHEA